LNKRELGTVYEQKAANFLISNGYTIIDRNFCCKLGELDLIARSEDYLCFIEVKFRSNNYRGFPGEAINYKKISKISKTAEYYMLINNIPMDTPCRFDVVVILNKEITLIKNAFDAYSR